ncbi:tRNA-binding protein [Aeropyrum pernix K1]|uniref:Methionine--tRNA ligase n=1 Tax=Aeropyrum pernix (strain ATCC 700893 / DSM 11879 / JCM 9820 / NBRC 100138 / K1) TaxID=272557 RepID=Q9YE98_AERPE|nr:methionine--tRNA ligase subunit beta [Aeropyrum pernix]BAA79648.2 tRNA-binding protein [Aeropyrum pernix K1]
MASGGEAGLIGIEDFAKVDLRVGRVVKAERLPHSKKLLKLIVDIGGEERQVLAGIAKWYSPEELVGRLVIVVANLQPKRMAGEVSQGMVLAAPCGDSEKPVLLTVSEPVEPGSRVC